MHTLITLVCIPERKVFGFDLGQVSPIWFSGRYPAFNWGSYTLLLTVFGVEPGVVPDWAAKGG